MKTLSVRILKGPDVVDVLARGGVSRIETLTVAAVEVTRKVHGVLGVTVAEHSVAHGVHATVQLDDGADEHALRFALNTLTPQGAVLSAKG